MALDGSTFNASAHTSQHEVDAYDDFDSTTYYHFPRKVRVLVLEFSVNPLCLVPWTRCNEETVTYKPVVQSFIYSMIDIACRNGHASMKIPKKVGIQPILSLKQGIVVLGW